jgi:thiol-disulfide isomerase/thioredoxin
MRRVPASQREVADEAPLVHRPARAAKAGPVRGSELYALLAVLTMTTILSGMILLQMGMFGSVKWENEGDSRVHFLDGEPKVFDEFIKARPDNMVAFVFYTKTCPHCKRMRVPFLEASAAYPDVTFIAIDGKLSPDLADRYRVDAVPTVVFMPYPRREDRVAWYPGLPELAPLRKWIDSQILAGERVIKAGFI